MNADEIRNEAEKCENLRKHIEMSAKSGLKNVRVFGELHPRARTALEDEGFVVSINKLNQWTVNW